MKFQRLLDELFRTKHNCLKNYKKKKSISIGNTMCFEYKYEFLDKHINIKLIFVN